MASNGARVLLLLFALVTLHWQVASPSHSLTTFYADNGLDQTIAYRYLPARKRREMQQEILNLLGLHHRPKPKRTDNSAPKYLIDLYKSLLDEESGNLKVDENRHPVVIEGEVLTKNSLHAINDSDIIMSFANKINHHAPHLRHDRDRRFWFDVSEVLPGENLVEAELRLHRDISGNELFANNGTFTLTLYSLSQDSDPEDKVLNAIDKKTVTNDEGWLMFNVTQAVTEWVAFPRRNLGLYLRIESPDFDRELHPSEIGLVTGRGPKDRQPFMLAFFQTLANGNVRERRGTRKKQKASVSYYDPEDWNALLNAHERYASSRTCQKRELYVSFRDLGWQDWIIAPDGYAAFFCQGECSFPLNAHMNATNHAIVQTLVHLMNPYLVPKPCCAPTKLTAIMVLYFDDNSNVILKKYKHMVVKSCGCH